MPTVPELNLPKRDFGKWQPDKQEVYNMRYWKAKKSRVKSALKQESKKVKRPKLKDKRLFNDIYDQDQHLRSI